ncbi:hypothetical protein BSKO_13365 [Bryopsis sp. KO-2023]|nr:hypothetical protein BSKO_13365 [Bryopsis sp. KO-2023]
MDASIWENIKPWGALLKFVRAADETTFRAERSKSTPQKDLFNFSGLLCLGASYAFLLTVYHGPTLGVAIFLGCMLLTAARITLVAFRKAWFFENRTVLLAVMHQGHAILATLASRYVPMPTLESAAFVPIALLMRTPVAILVSFGPLMAIPFRFHLFSQLVACFASSLWVPWFCDRCNDPSNSYPIETASDLFPNLHQGITQWLHRSTIVGVFINSQEPPVEQSLCWPSMLFLHWTFAFFVPCLVAYCVEVRQRWEFVASPSRRSPFASNARTDAYGSLFMGFWGAFMMVQATWIMLREIGGALQENPKLDSLCA